VKCYLVNTGWVGGAFGVGERMSLKYTRAMVNAAVAGELDGVAVTPHPVFRVLVPKNVPGVPAELLDARGQWKDGAEYDRAAEALSGRFKKNFEKFGQVAEQIMEAAPA
jgi:phosphoenolpyruvate carboxykinase (ATP)